MNKFEIEKFAEIIFVNKYITEYQDSRFHKIDDKREDHEENYNTLKVYCKENYDFEIDVSSFFLEEDGFATIIYREDADFADDYEKLKLILIAEFKKFHDK